MKLHGIKALVAAATLISTTALAGAAAASDAVLTVQNNTPVTLNYVNHSCIGTMSPAAWPATISSGNNTTLVASSTLTSNGCSITYRRADNLRSCRFVATRIRSSLTGPWNYPTVNTTASGSGITCTYTITSVAANGDWAVTLNVN